jgi:hypothetical protein
MTVALILCACVILGTNLSVPYIRRFIRVRAVNPSPVACINNLRQIDAAKQQWGMANNKTPGDTPTWNDLRLYLSRGNGVMPTCPEGGVYSLNCLSNVPQCSVPLHRLPYGTD